MRRVVAVLLTLLAFVTLAGAVPAGADTASLSGTIVGADTGAAVGGQCLDAYTADTYEWVSSTCSADDGSWTIDNLQTGVQYKIQVQPGSGYVGQWVAGHGDFSSADSFTAPGDPITITVQRAATVAGTLTDAAGQPVPDATVEVHDAGTGEQLGISWTDWNGQWSADVAATSVKVAFWVGSRVQWAKGQTSQDTATVFDLAAGETTTVDDALLPAATLTGHVTDAATGAPVAGACVSVYDAAAQDQWAGTIGYACSNDAGSFTVGDLTASAVKLEVTDDSGAHVTQWYDGQSSLADATPVTVPAGGTADVAVRLAPAGFLTGTVLDHDTKTPLEGVCVQAYDGRTDRATGMASCTDAQGVWRMGGLPGGQVSLHFQPGDQAHVDQWAVNAATQAEADLFTVQPGQTVKVPAVKLRSGGRITGVVTDAATGRPVSNVCVAIGVLSPRVGGCDGDQRDVQTDDAGRFTMTGLTSGSYVLTFADLTGDHAWQFSGDAASRSTATPVTVKVGKTTTYDAALVAGGTVSGTVTEADGSAYAGYATVDAVDPATGELIGFSSDVAPDRNAFTVRGLPTARLELRVQTDDGRTAQATVDAVAGQVVSGTQIALPAPSAG